MENSMEAPQKLKIELPYEPEIPFLGIYPKECKSAYNKKAPAHSVYCSINHNN
jgi:hypothetical protein